MVDSNTISQEELEEMPEKGERGGWIDPRVETFRHAILCDLVFSDMDMCQVPFAGSLLAGVTFDYVELIWCDFLGAKLPASDFVLCDLRNISFLNADLREAVFDSCDLRGIQWNGANLNRVEFINCTGISRERLDKLTTGQYTIDTDTKETDQ